MHHAPVASVLPRLGDGGRRSYRDTRGGAPAGSSGSGSGGGAELKLSPSVDSVDSVDDSSLYGGGVASRSALPAPNNYRRHHPIHGLGGGGGGGGGSVLSPSGAPSALRKGKYSSATYARSDVGGGGGAAAASLGRYYDDAGENYHSASRAPLALQSGADAAAGVPEEELLLPLRELPGTVGSHGRIDARLSPRLLSLRKWRDSYWAHVYPTRLAVFRSEADFEAWKAGRGGSADEAVNAIADKKWIEWSVDFDTLGVIRKKERKMRKERRRKEKEERRRIRREKKLKKKKENGQYDHSHQDDSEVEGNYTADDDDRSVDESTLFGSVLTSLTADTAVTKDTIVTKPSSRSKSGRKSKTNKSSPPMSPALVGNSVLKYSLLPVRSKPLKRSTNKKHEDGGEIASHQHAFKLEKWTRKGASPAASFSSSDTSEIRALRSCARELIEACERDRGGKRQSSDTQHYSKPTKPTTVKSTPVGAHAGATSGAASFSSPTDSTGTAATSNTPSSYGFASPLASGVNFASPAAPSSGRRSPTILEEEEGESEGGRHVEEAQRHHAANDEDGLLTSLSTRRRRGPRFGCG